MSADLLYSDTEDALRESVRALLAATCPSERVTEAYDGDTSVAYDAWRAVSDAMELAGLGIDESLGGGGATSREVAVVMEELGRVVAPIPFLTSSVIATRVLVSCGAGDLVRTLVDGSAVAVLTVPLTTMDLGDLTLPTVAGGLVTGRVHAVAGCELATLMIVPALDGTVLTLQAIEPQSGSTSVTMRSSFDMTRPVADVGFTAAPATELARGADAESAVRAGLLAGGAMLASEQVGLAEWCLESTVAYTKQRNQFGRPIGSFQALKHRMARLWIAVNSARAAARNAAVLVDAGGDEAAVAVGLAQAYCSDVAVLAAEECVQLHGGIGMTWEHPAHLYLKRAKADQVALGTAAHHRAVLAEGLTPT